MLHFFLSGSPTVTSVKVMVLVKGIVKERRKDNYNSRK
jgi:hypothetical protein